MRGERSELLLIFLRRPAADQHQELSRRDGASHLSLLVQRTLAQRNTPRLRARRVAPGPRSRRDFPRRSEEHTSELQSLMRISYAVFCLKKKNRNVTRQHQKHDTTTYQYEA